MLNDGQKRRAEHVSEMLMSSVTLYRASKVLGQELGWGTWPTCKCSLCGVCVCGLYACGVCVVCVHVVCVCIWCGLCLCVVCVHVVCECGV